MWKREKIRRRLKVEFTMAILKCAADRLSAVVNEQTAALPDASALPLSTKPVALSFNKAATSVNKPVVSGQCDLSLVYTNALSSDYSRVGLEKCSRLCYN